MAACFSLLLYKNCAWDTPNNPAVIIQLPETALPEASTCRTYLGIGPAADHCIPLSYVDTVWMADQVVVHPSHIGVFVSCHRAIDIMEDGVLITIQLTILKPGARLSKEDVQRDLAAERTRNITE